MKTGGVRQGFETDSLPSTKGEHHPERKVTGTNDVVYTENLLFLLEMWIWNVLGRGCLLNQSPRKTLGTEAL